MRPTNLDLSMSEISSTLMIGDIILKEFENKPIEMRPCHDSPDKTYIANKDDKTIQELSARLSKVGYSLRFFWDRCATRDKMISESEPFDENRATIILKQDPNHPNIYRITSTCAIG